MPSYTGVVGFVYDFQSLITGVAAVGAALWATRYGRRQSRLATRDLLVNRAKSLVVRRNEVAKLTQEVKNMVRHLRPWENEVVEPDSLWAHSSEQTVDVIVADLQAQQDTSLDGKAVDGSRTKLIAACELLSACLFDIHAVQSVDFGGYEEPPLSAKPAYAARAAKAAEEVEGKISKVSAQSATLDDAFSNRLAEIRREMRKLERFALRK